MRTFLCSRKLLVPIDLVQAELDLAQSPRTLFDCLHDLLKLGLENRFGMAFKLVRLSSGNAADFNNWLVILCEGFFEG